MSCLRSSPPPLWPTISRIQFQLCIMVDKALHVLATACFFDFFSYLCPVLSLSWSPFWPACPSYLNKSRCCCLWAFAQPLPECPAFDLAHRSSLISKVTSSESPKWVVLSCYISFSIYLYPKFSCLLNYYPSPHLQWKFLSRKQGLGLSYSQVYPRYLACYLLKVGVLI